MTQYQIREGGVFTIDSISDISIEYVRKFFYPGNPNYNQPDMWYFEYKVKAKIQPALATSGVVSAKVTVTGESSPKPMYKEFPGNPGDYFWKTTDIFTKTSPTSTFGPLYAKVEAVIQSDETPETLTYNLVYP